MATIISTKTSGVGGLEVTGDATGILQLASNNGTTAVTVDASQNVGIGTASPLTVLHTYSSNAGTPTTSGSATTGVSARFQNMSVNFDFGTYSSGQCFIQPRLIGNNATNFDLVLNPNGGNLLFNSGYGSAAVAYGCRAWVNFNGTGTVAINASGNVSSITDNGTGLYTVNFTTAMPDANYGVAGWANYANAAPAGLVTGTSGTTKTASALQTAVANSTTAANIDVSNISISIFR